MPYKLNDVFVKSWSTSGDADTFNFTDVPKEAETSEEVAFYYNKIAYQYAPTEDGKDFTEIEWTYATQDDAASDVPPPEELSLGYTEVEWTY